MVQQFLGHNCLTQAGALTYTTLFAVVPMMTVAYAMFSVLPEFESVGERIMTVAEAAELAHRSIDAAPTPAPVFGA